MRKGPTLGSSMPKKVKIFMSVSQDCFKPILCVEHA